MYGACDKSLNLLFPPTCISCNRAGYLLCPLCSQQVKPIPAPICGRCGRAQPNQVDECSRCLRPSWKLARVRAAGLFTDPLQRAIHALKYEGQKELAAPLARYLVIAYDQLLPCPAKCSIDLIIPVPLHPQRQQERGFNQAQLLAEAFGVCVGQPVATQELRRVRFVAPQVGLDFDARQENVREAFDAAPGLAGKRVLLIDDVITTGATFNACANALREVGVCEVYGLALAMAG